MSVVLDKAAHAYSDGTGQKFVSVTTIIDRVLGTSYEGIPPEVLQNAAERGIQIEAWATELMQTGGVMLPSIATTEDEKRRKFFEGFYAWWEESQPTLIYTQKILHSEDVAGCLDFVLKVGLRDVLIDMKCTSEAMEAKWRLQVGAYCTMYDAPLDACGILHINPKFSKGWIWREYDPVIVKSQWAVCLAWYRCMESLKVKSPGPSREG